MKAIKTVKSKQQLATLLEGLGRQDRALLQQWIDLDPIYTGTVNKADYETSIRKHLEMSADLAPPGGLWCEFGVREGRSLRWLIEHSPDQIIHAFDSWQGLPEDWNHGTGKVADMSCDPPEVPAHIQLHQGWFADTVPAWKRTNTGPVSFLHMDADIYTSTITVLSELNDQIVPGTVIVFDEFCNFRLSGKMSQWQQQEFRALTEWLVRYNRQVVPVNRNWCYQATCRVTR